jgi:dGTPase
MMDFRIGKKPPVRMHPVSRPVPARRQLIEAREINLLHPFAALSRTDHFTDRRIHLEGLDPYRTRFARDRDRILHSQYFMLLIGKSQVFPVLDHIEMRTKQGAEVSWKFTPVTTMRLFHSLRVAQLAKSIARAVRLNEDLVETQALAHDMGHVPFGHAGERAIQKIQESYPDPDASYFRHERNSLNVVDRLERMAGAYFEGLNLTFEVRDGILHHCGEKPSRVLVPRPDDDPSLELKQIDVMPVTLEGCLLRIMDFVGYAPQDYHDMRQAGWVGSVPEEISRVLGDNTRTMYDRMVKDIIAETSRAFRDGKKQIVMSQEVYDALDRLIAFNYEVIMQYLATYEEEYLSPDILHLFEQKSMGMQEFIDYLVGLTDAQLMAEIEMIRSSPDDTT